MNLKKVMKGFAWMEDILLMSSLVIIFLALLLQVVSRYVFNKPITWTEELARFLQIWITYIGINYAIRNSAHIRITALTERLPAKVQLILEIFVNLVMLICVGFFLPQSVVFYLDQTLVRSTVMKLPLNWIVLPLVVGFLIAGISLAILTYEKIRLLIKGEEVKTT